jgi:hypothetical protein
LHWPSGCAAATRARSNPTTSRNCCRDHAAVGCAVTAMHTSRRLPCSMATATWSNRNVAVTAMKKSRPTIASAARPAGRASTAIHWRCVLRPSLGSRSPCAGSADVIPADQRLGLTPRS